jgi:hypothetical protein
LATSEKRAAEVEALVGLVLAWLGENGGDRVAVHQLPCPGFLLDPAWHRLPDA